MIKTTILFSMLLAMGAGVAHADGGNHNGNNNVGAFSGNMNGALSGNNMNSRSRSTATSNYNGYQGIDGSGNTSNANNTTFRDRLQAPGIAAPGLSSGANTCAGSYGLGISVPGFGLSGGRTYEMRGCEARANAEILRRYGYRGAAVQLLVNEVPAINRAMTMTGGARPIKKR